MQSWAVVGLALGEEFCDCRQQFGKWARIPRLVCPPGFRLNECIDSGSQVKDVEDVGVVVSPCRPRMREVQQQKREVCSVGRANGGNEVCQEASALLSVGALSV